MTTLHLVSKPRRACHFKLVGQHGRGSNRRAIYVCQHHAGHLDCANFTTVFKGFSVKKKTSPFFGAP